VAILGSSPDLKEGQDPATAPPPTPLPDAELAPQLWWRAAALEALSAYVLGVLGKGLATNMGGQVGVGGMTRPLQRQKTARQSLVL
jgi:hypothetical protein